jgi:hypothetical protein
MLTPNELEILIHYYVCPEIHDRFNAPAVEEACNKFVQDGIFIEDEFIYGKYTVTKKGQSWINNILNTPMPIEVWVDPRNFKNN